ncbi:hypothetical protein [Amycolatopsis sp. RTGN1]|uniref:hypothetical protein n=1 Tax=Amycolatopsis ponsaeliensis TaxID=2992142 RepID=UPI00254FB198|nr:hypothetical protein [Amycolatopsis sp. RTGN1]
MAVSLGLAERERRPHAHRDRRHRVDGPDVDIALADAGHQWIPHSIVRRLTTLPVTIRRASQR